MTRIPGTTTRRVRTLVLVPSPATPGLTTTEQLAVTLRRDATITGRCVCGATFPRVRVKRGQVAQVAMRHEADCPAAGPHIDRMAARLGDALEYEGVLVDVEVAAA